MIRNLDTETDSKLLIVLLYLGSNVSNFDTFCRGGVVIPS